MYTESMLGKNIFIIILSLFLFALPAYSEENDEIEENFPPNAILNASYRGDEHMVRRILEAGTDVDTRDGLGATALHSAMLQPNLIIIKLLLDYGFDPNAVIEKNGKTPLHYAVTANNLNAARLLLQYGANRQIKELAGLTPLEKARKEGKGPLVNLLSH